MVNFAHKLRKAGAPEITVGNTLLYYYEGRRAQTYAIVL